MEPILPLLTCNNTIGIPTVIIRNNTCGLLCTQQAWNEYIAEADAHNQTIEALASSLGIAALTLLGISLLSVNAELLSTRVRAAVNIYTSSTNWIWRGLYFTSTRAATAAAVVLSLALYYLPRSTSTENFYNTYNACNAACAHVCCVQPDWQLLGCPSAGIPCEFLQCVSSWFDSSGSLLASLHPGGFALFCTGLPILGYALTYSVGDLIALGRHLTQRGEEEGEEIFVSEEILTDNELAPLHLKNKEDGLEAPLKGNIDARICNATLLMLFAGGALIITILHMSGKISGNREIKPLEEILEGCKNCHNYFKYNDYNY